MTIPFTVLITLGRLPPSIDLARSFSAAGWRVLIAEPFRWHLARTSRSVDRAYATPAPAQDPEGYRRAILDIVEQEAVTLIVPVSEETMHVVALASQLPDHCRLFSSDAATTRRLHSKLGFIETALEAGLDVPKTARSGTPLAAELIAAGDVFEKPEYSCSGRSVKRLQRAADAPLVTGMLIQQAISGEEVSAFAITRGGRIIAHVCYRAVVRHGSVAIVFERIERPAVTAWLAGLVTHTQYSGFISIDAIIESDDRVIAIECNPRATSGLHFFDKENLADAIAGNLEQLMPAPTRVLQEFWSALTHYLTVFWRPDQRRKTGQAIRDATDITWDKRDPGVFLLAFLSTWPIISKAIARRATFAEVSTLDLEWTGHDEA
ncbi:MAG: ATP-grasp domain-containing protein [Woeseiaceae bacterium]